MTTPYRQIRALFDAETITVYQAYSDAIATRAVEEQKLNASPAFRVTCMTWIKPSWNWMMYRSGYSYKNTRQTRILAIKMKHEHFLELLSNAVLTSGHTGAKETNGEQAKTEPAKHNTLQNTSAGVKVQWDPERTVRLEKLPYRSIQIGIPAALMQEWVEKWIVDIEDVTQNARVLEETLRKTPGISEEALATMGLVPQERMYGVSGELRKLLEMDMPEI